MSRPSSLFQFLLGLSLGVALMLLFINSIGTAEMLPNEYLRYPSIQNVDTMTNSADESPKPFKQSPTASLTSKQEEDGWFLHPDGQSVCAPNRDISKVRLVRHTEQSKNFPGCLRYQCVYDEARCDNNIPTDYTTVPCCVHILRDIAQLFDRIMCYMGLEYFSNFGTLLGLVRSDRLIPWTSDNDFNMDVKSIVVMKQLWNTARNELKHGLGLVFHGAIFRLCPAPDFADGQLQKWAMKDDGRPYYDVSPYTDIYNFHHKGNTIVDITKCQFQNDDIFPLQRKAFYGGTVFQQVPKNPNAVLTHIYGDNWRIPDSGKSQHGHTNCKAQFEAANTKKWGLPSLV